MSLDLPIDIESVKGFLPAHEGEALHALALAAAALGPCLEIGSYCGKSTVYLGAACRAAGSVLFALDHHRGSEEHQPGQEHHDPDLCDGASGGIDSFATFRSTLAMAGLEDVVVPIVAPSALVARHWTTPLALLFIDGGHSLEAALTDYRGFAPHVRPGGFLAIHDVFPDPADGGRAPYTIYRLALESGLFEERSMTDSLAILRRLG